MLSAAKRRSACRAKPFASLGAREIFAELCSRAKRWQVVGARFIAPTGWRGAHVRMSLPPPRGLAPT